MQRTSLLAEWLTAHAKTSFFALAAVGAILPFIYLFLRGVPYFEIAPEFVAYRIGNALAVIYGEFGAIRLVQGLPTALISQVIVRAMHQVLGINPATLAGMQIYAAAFFVICFGAALILVRRMWAHLTGLDVAAMAMMAIVPLYLTGASPGLLLAPEYWFGEYLYLIVSLAALAALRRMQMNDLRLLLLGAWLAVGIGIKITMIGIVPFFLLTLPKIDRRWLSLIAAGAATTYVAMAFLYMGLRPNMLLELLAFQIEFYLFPNESRTYAGGTDTLLSNPPLILLTAIALVLVTLSAQSKWREGLAAIGWIAIFAYLVWKRPHFTSVASAATAMTFLICYFAGSFRRLGLSFAMIAAATLVLFHSHTTAWLSLPETVRANETPRTKLTGLAFVPDNYLNAGLPEQAMIFNGMIGLHPVESGPDGKARYRVGGRALRAAIGDVVLLRGDEYSISVGERAFLQGTPITWTRAEDPNYGTDYTHKSMRDLKAMLSRHNARITEERFYRFGRWWYAARAEISQ